MFTVWSTCQSGRHHVQTCVWLQVTGARICSLVKAATKPHPKKIVCCCKSPPHLRALHFWPGRSLGESPSSSPDADRAAAAKSSSLAVCSSESASDVSSPRSRPTGPPCDIETAPPKKSKHPSAHSGASVKNVQEIAAHRVARAACPPPNVPVRPLETYPSPRQVHPVLLPRLHESVCLRRGHILVRLKLLPHVLHTYTQPHRGRQARSKVRYGSNNEEDLALGRVHWESLSS